MGMHEVYNGFKLMVSSQKIVLLMVFMLILGEIMEGDLILTLKLVVKNIYY
jgi:hypothetical protein